MNGTRNESYEDKNNFITYCNYIFNISASVGPTGHNAGGFYICYFLFFFFGGSNHNSQVCY